MLPQGRSDDDDDANDDASDDDDDDDDDANDDGDDNDDDDGDDANTNLSLDNAHVRSPNAQKLCNALLRGPGPFHSVPSYSCLHPYAGGD